MSESADTKELLDQWRADLESWAIPKQILDQAEVPPWIHPVAMFTVEGEIPETASSRIAREVLAEGDSVVDVGCGGGRAAMALIPPAGTVIGVDHQQGMLDQFALAAITRGAHHHEYLGFWNDVADEVPEADVVVCHHVVFNVAEIGPFLQQLDWHARKRVVIEMPLRHPMSNVNALWKRFWNVERPTSPTAEQLLSICRSLGFDAQILTWADPTWGNRAPQSQAERIEHTRIRLCLTADRDEEIAQALADMPATPTEIATIWWDTTRA